MIERWLSNGILRLIVQVGVVCIAVGLLMGKVSAVQTSVEGLTDRVQVIEEILMQRP